VHRPGQPLYPYTGYSGDRCMPGDWYPPLPHAALAAAIKQVLDEKGLAVPVASVGKISDPEEAERLLIEGKADLIGMARQLLADPDWPRKLREGRREAILRCIYCNVCKQLDENFKEVHCFLWPKGARQAPREAAPGAAPPPRWGADGGGLSAALAPGQIKLAWSRPAAGEVAGYDIYRAEDGGAVRCLEAVKGTRFVDRGVLGGVRYTYYVRAYDAGGRASAPSNSIVVEPAIPDFASEPKSREALHA
jgi:hypothetical protein